MLTRAQEYKLADIVIAGNSDDATPEDISNKNIAVDYLVEHNTGLVHDIVRKYCRPETDSHLYNDLVQQGFQGLVIAANKFDPAHETRFSTYATYWIRQSVGRFHRTKTKALTVPDAKVIDYARKAREAAKKNQDFVPDDPSLHAAIMPPAMILSTSVFEDEFSQFFIPSEESFENSVVDKIAIEQTMTLIETCCTASEYRVLRHRLGFETGYKMTFGEVGATLDITPTNANALYNKAIKKIRAMNDSKKLFA